MSDMKTAAVAGGTATITYAWGEEDGVPKRFPVVAQGRILRTYANTSRTLTMPDTRGGIITSTSSGGTILTLPTFATLGYARDPVNPVEIAFMFQRGGSGPLFVTPASGVTINWNDMDPQYLPQDHPPLLLVSNGANTWVAG